MYMELTEVVSSEWSRFLNQEAVNRKACSLNATEVNNSCDRQSTGSCNNLLLSVSSMMFLQQCGITLGTVISARDLITPNIMAAASRPATKTSNTLFDM